MQFGFKEGVGCTEASFTILETINHILERRRKAFGCFLDARKALISILCGSMVCSVNYFLSLVSEGECGWLSKICIRVSKHR